MIRISGIQSIIIKAIRVRMLRVKEKKTVYLVALNAVLGSFLFGYQMVDISILERLFANINHTTVWETPVQISLITAAMPFGAFIGALLLKCLMSLIKARFLMMALDVAAITGCQCIYRLAIQAISITFYPLFLGRLLIGVVVGVNCGVIPKYIYSVTPTSLSGSVGSLHPVFIMVGVAVGCALGFIINPSAVDDQLNWRVVLCFPMVTCLVRTVNLALFLPYEIPSHRLLPQEIQRLERYYYNTYENYPGSLNDSRLSASSQDLDEQPTVQVKDNQGYNLTICLVLAFSNQICGINAILFYAKQLFMEITHQDDALSQLLIMALGIEQIVACLIGGYLTDRVDKRKFMIAGELFMVVCLVLIFSLDSSELAVIILIFCHTIAYSLSVGQMLMYFATKMLNNTSYVMLMNWLVTFLVALCSEMMMTEMGIGNMCLIFAGMLMLSLLILIKGMPQEAYHDDINEPLMVHKHELKDISTNDEISIEEMVT